MRWQEKPLTYPISKGKAMKNNFKTIFLTALVTAALFAAAWVMFMPGAPEPSEAVAVPAAEADAVKGEEKKPVAIRSGTVRAYAPAAKANLKLPADVAMDDAKQVIAAHTVDPDEHPQTVTTVIDTDTGESKTYVKPEPIPTFAWNFHGDAGIYAGLKNGERAIRLEVRQGVAQFKAVHVGALASADQPLASPLKADYFIGMGAWYRW